MSSTTSALPSGIEQLYDSGLLPSNLSQETLNTASGSQLNQIAGATVALQQVSALLGNAGSSDSVTLSPEALNSLLLPGNSAQDNSVSGDYFTQAVNNALTNNINSAVNTFLPPSTTHTGTNINVVG
jgi:hypothetical protein